MGDKGKPADWPQVRFPLVRNLSPAPPLSSVHTSEGLGRGGRGLGLVLHSGLARRPFRLVGSGENERVVGVGISVAQVPFFILLSAKHSGGGGNEQSPVSQSPAPQLEGAARRAPLGDTPDPVRGVGAPSLPPSPSRVILDPGLPAAGPGFPRAPSLPQPTLPVTHILRPRSLCSRRPPPSHPGPLGAVLCLGIWETPAQGGGGVGREQVGGNLLGAGRPGRGPGPGKRRREELILSSPLPGPGRGGARPERDEGREIPQKGPSHSPRGARGGPGVTRCVRVKLLGVCVFVSLFLKIVVRFG